MARYAQSILNRYDENKSGKLEKEEVGKMRSSYATADANKDGSVTIQELTQHLGNFGSSNGGGGGGGGGGAAGGGSSSSTASTSSENRDWRGGRSRDRERERPRGEGSSRDVRQQRASYRFLTADERVSNQLPGNLRDWFLRTDEDNDGQVSMAEFASSWSDEKAKEFQQLDLNNDGIVTPHEYTASQGR